ncbi:MAG: Hint domain-containing protein [Pseudoruegeria sp.]
MAVYSFIGYDPSVINFSGGTVELDDSYNLTEDRVNISVNDTASGGTIGSGGDSHTDNGVIFDGDRYSNENGDDNSQFGTLTEIDGTPITSGQVYLEQSYTLTSGGTTITLYRVEIAGDVVGYVASSPLEKDVTYTFSTSNVTPGNAPNTTTNAIVDVPCFVAGTLIETPAGAVAIETLTVGDFILNAAGEPRKIRWTGSKIISPKFHRDRDLYPVCIGKGALGEDLPRRDLLVSANHRIVLDGAEVQLFTGKDRAFVPAKFLVGQPGINRVRTLDLVHYVHLLLDEHEILMAEGLAAESLHPGDMALQALSPDAVDEILYLFPSLKEQPYSGYGPLALQSLKSWEARVCVAARACVMGPVQIAA